MNWGLCGATRDGFAPPMKLFVMIFDGTFEGPLWKTPPYGLLSYLPEDILREWLEGI